MKSDRAYMVDVVGAWRTDRLLLTEQEELFYPAALLVGDVVKGRK